MFLVSVKNDEEFGDVAQHAESPGLAPNIEKKKEEEVRERRRGRTGGEGWEGRKDERRCKGL